jgi:hypothetical protein
MMEHCRIEAGAIIEGPMPLPLSWQAADGTTHGNMRDRPAAELIALGWRPVQDINAAYDAATQKRAGPVLAVLTDRVTRTWTVTNKTAQELSDEKDAEAVGAVDGMKALKAVVVWVAPLVGKTPAQARSEILAIYKALP